MRVLLIKTSSLGDVIHALPALTDARLARRGIRFDWVVEEGFARIPAWHPAVAEVIPVALRRWRSRPLRALLGREWREARQRLGRERYDAVIDAQGLLKSAVLTRYARGPVHGLDRDSAREPLASLFYDHRHPVAWGRHAVARVRELFARALGYPPPAEQSADGLAADPYGLDRARVLGGTPSRRDDQAPYLLFLHGTSWPTKHWPEAYWRRLADMARAEGWQVRLPWGNDAERARAERLASGLANARVLPRLSLDGIAAEIAGARACVAVDTGLGHLAAALAVPTVSLYGPTNPAYTGAWGFGQRHLASDFPCAPCLRKRCAYVPRPEDRARPDFAREQPPCFTRLPPERVWEELGRLLASPALPGQGGPDTARHGGIEGRA